MLSALILLILSIGMAWLFKPYFFVLSDTTSWIGFRGESLKIFAALIIIFLAFRTYFSYWFLFPYIAIASAGKFGQSAWYIQETVPSVQKLAIFWLLFSSLVLFSIITSLTGANLSKKNLPIRSSAVLVMALLSIVLAQLPLAYASSYYAEKYSDIYIPTTDKVTHSISEGDLRNINVSLEYVGVQQPQPPAIATYQDSINIIPFTSDGPAATEDKCKSKVGHDGAYTWKEVNKLRYLEASYDNSSNYGLAPGVPAPITYTGYAYCYKIQNYLYIFRRDDAMNEKTTKYPIDYLLRHIEKFKFYDYKSQHMSK